MKVLFTSSDSVYSGKSYGGAETSLALLAREFAKSGEQVSYLSNRKKFFPGYKITCDEEASLNLYMINNIRFPKLNIRFIDNLITKLKTWYRNRIISQILSLVDPDIAYVFGNMLHPLVEVRNAGGFHFPIVLRVAGFEPGLTVNLQTEIQQKYYNYLCEIAAFNYQSEEHRLSFKTLRENAGLPLPEKKELVADIGIHGDFFSVRKASSRKVKNVFKLICIMRFSARKRQDIIIKALKILNDKSVLLQFIGEGNELQRIKNLANQLGVEDQVSFCGFLSRNEIIQEFNRSHLYVHPVDYEPQSKALWEAMAMQIPVLASNVMTINGMIRSGQSGYMAVNEPESWANWISKIRKNYRETTQITENAYEYVSKIANPKENLSQFISFFESFQEI